MLLEGSPKALRARRAPYSTTTVTSNSIHPIGVTHFCAVPQVWRDAVISTVPRARAVNVRGGSEHVPPGGRHTMAIGEMPGASTAGLLDAGAEGQGNCSATISVPTATCRVVPFCAGVMVSVPCVALGAEAGGLGCGEDRDKDGGDAGRDGADEAGADADGCPEPEPPWDPGSEGVAGGDCVPDPESLGEGLPDGFPGPVPAP